MLVMREGSETSMMRGIIVTEEHLACPIHILIAIFIKNDAIGGFRSEKGYFQNRTIDELQTAPEIKCISGRPKMLFDL